jgi:hypothetical protein
MYVCMYTQNGYIIYYTIVAARPSKGAIIYERRTFPMVYNILPSNYNNNNKEVGTHPVP